MKITIPQLLAVCLLSTTILATPAFAVVTFAGKGVGSWSNPSASGAGVVESIANNDDAAGPASVASFDFGSPSALGDRSNLFTFNGVGSGGTPGFTTPANTSFALGAFTYRNGTTTNYPAGNSSVQFNLQLTLTSPAASTTPFNYKFGIDITPNTTGNPVLDADTVTIGTGLTSQTINVNGTLYTLALLGFSKDGGTTFTNTFVAPEETTTGAELYASVTTNIVAVPEPAPLALFGLGVLGSTLLLRRRPSERLDD